MLPDLRKERRSKLAVEHMHAQNKVTDGWEELKHHGHEEL